MLLIVEVLLIPVNMLLSPLKSLSFAPTIFSMTSNISPIASPSAVNQDAISAVLNFQLIPSPYQSFVLHFRAICGKAFAGAFFCGFFFNFSLQPLASFIHFASSKDTPASWKSLSYVQLKHKDSSLIGRDDQKEKPL
jgi:hypothetical protein